MALSTLRLVGKHKDKIGAISENRPLEIVNCDNIEHSKLAICSVDYPRKKSSRVLIHFKSALRHLYTYAVVGNQAASRRGLAALQWL